MVGGEERDDRGKKWSGEGLLELPCRKKWRNRDGRDIEHERGKREVEGLVRLKNGRP